MIVSTRITIALVMLAVSAGGPVRADATTTETILFIRHGEKPEEGLGQLSCQGLNRALALPGVIRRKYQRLDAVFAPNPSEQKPDGPGDDGDDRTAYDYVRPLATAEPTAIAFGLPVRTEIGFRDIAKLKAALLEPAYRNATVLVAWEHHMIHDLVPDLVGSLGGKPDDVPKWKKKDFDSIWRVTIQRTGANASVAFAVDQEGLNDRPTSCPN